MLHSTLVPLLGLVPSVLSVPMPQASFVPSPGNFPAKADGDYAGGIFSIPLSDLGKYAGAGGAYLLHERKAVETNIEYTLRYRAGGTQGRWTEDFWFRPIPSGNDHRLYAAWSHHLRTENTPSWQP